jgi:hypothetical protein
MTKWVTPAKGRVEKATFVVIARFPAPAERGTVAISFSTLLPLLNFYYEIATSSRPPGRSRLLAMTLRGFSTRPQAGVP